MKRVWLLLVAGLMGCTTTPKREMRATNPQEFTTPPPHMYLTPPDLPRDKPLLTPKNPGPGFNTPPSVGGPGMGGPSFGPGAPGAFPQ
jgi:hypothetical protein